MTTSFHVIIPARRGSTRLAGKMLADVQGRALILHTLDRACASSAASVHVATDDDDIAGVVQAAGGAVLMTSADHASGTDRLAEAVEILGLSGDAIVVNLQGDEPEMPVRCLEQVAGVLDRDRSADMATLWSLIDQKSVWQDPNVVKVLTDHSGRALMFTRSAVPFPRDGRWPADQARRHVGLYAYRASALKQWPDLPVSLLEQCESLEQLRALQAAWWIACDEAVESIPIGIDTLQDLERFRGRVADVD